MLLCQHKKNSSKKNRKEGKLCQTCIMNKAKVGSSTRFERTLINGVDRWSLMVPHLHEKFFSFFVCQSLSHSLPLSEPVSCWTLHRMFSSLADSTTHERFLRQEYHLITLSICLTSPFISRLFSIHIQRTHLLARPFA